MNNAHLLFNKWLWTASLILGGLTVNENTAMGQGASQANESTRSTSLGITWGYYAVKAQDLLFSPHPYSGGQTSGFGLHFKRTRSNQQITVDLRAEMLELDAPFPLIFQLNGSARSRQDNHFTGLRLGVGYSRKIRSYSNWELWLGGNIETQFRWVEFGMALSEEDSYLLNTSLSPQAKAIYQLSKNQTLSLSVQVPLLNMISRNKFAVVDNEEIQYDGSDLSFLYGEGSFQSLNSFQSIDLQLAWTRTLSIHWDFSLTYQFNYARFSEPQTYSMRKNNIYLGFAFKF